MKSIPEKAYYRIGEVCELTGTQPYVLRFWESEFPQLSPSRSRAGHPLYSRRDLDVVMRIRKLLHEDEYTLADARARLAAELSEVEGEGTASALEHVDLSEPLAEGEASSSPSGEPHTELHELRVRYADACAEIARLREELKSAAALRAELGQSQKELHGLRERVLEFERRATEVPSAPPELAGSLAAERQLRREVADRLERAVRSFREILDSTPESGRTPVS